MKHQVLQLRPAVRRRAVLRAALLKRAALQAALLKRRAALQAVLVKRRAALLVVRWQARAPWAAQALAARRLRALRPEEALSEGRQPLVEPPRVQAVQ